MVEQRGVAYLTMREVAQEAGISHGALQHYFASRGAMLSFAMDFTAEQTSLRVGRGLQKLGDEPHPVTCSGSCSRRHSPCMPMPARPAG